MKRLLTIAVMALAVGCGKDEPADNDTPGMDAQIGSDASDMGSTVPDTAMSPDTGTTTADATTTPDATSDASADMTSPTRVEEAEPNDGATLDEVNDFAVGTQMHGNIDAADSDVFQLDAMAGSIYRITLTLDAGSQLDPHVTVFDAGRDGNNAGDDYVKIVRGSTIEVLAMGVGGYFVAVRDARNVDGGSVGGTGFGYALDVDVVDPAAVATPLTFPDTLSGALTSAGAVDLWSFDGTEGMNVLFDFAANGDLDGRLLVFSTTQGSWIARQDDRTVGNPNPLLDAPLSASGPMFLVVENITEDATNLGYTIDASIP